MAEMTTEIAIHCMKAENCEEVCQNCLMYGKVGIDHCEYDAHRLAIKALEMQTKLKTWIRRYKETQKEYEDDKSFSKEKLISILKEFSIEETDY